MNFDPDKAEEVDDDSDESFFHELMETYEARVKKSRMKVVDDAFKTLLSAAKDERGKLIEDAKTELAACIEDCLAKHSDAMKAEIRSALQSGHDRMMAKTERLLASQKPAEANLSPEVIADLRDTLSLVRDGLKAKEDTPIALPTDTPKPKKWRHNIVRDDFGKCASIESCEITE